MDKLDRIFEMQRTLDEFIAESRGLEFEPEIWIQKQVLAMIAELGELLDEVNYKWWKNAKGLDRQAIVEELVDVFHFFIGACIRAGLSPDEFFQSYCRKNQENWNRQRGKSTREGYAIELGHAETGSKT
jgi:NTP pyrophosphatase (non-canonical NTP hydrolase)